MANFVIKTISITREQQEYLDKFPELKLSSITQAAIQQIIANRQCFEDRIKVLENRNKLLQDKLFKSTDFIAERGLMEEYGKLGTG